ncbi:hypothetical protein [Lactococcus lactis]|uniref:hypothetical protein n=1 Tax=Lactococcus lactis TaxID=1358 RepID=UPI0011115ED7|nr:hypothetical protein [Lactococcus lactis]
MNKEKILTSLNQLEESLNELFNKTITKVEEVDTLLLANGFCKCTTSKEIPNKRTKHGIYIFEAKVSLDVKFDELWKERQLNNKVPNLNDQDSKSNKILYVGKSTSSGVLSRVNEHYKTINELESTYALKIGGDEFKKYKISCNYYQYECDKSSYANAIIAIFEQLLHDKLQPRVGSSR